MKKIIFIVISLLTVGLVAFTLIENKEEMVEKAKLAEVTSDAIPVEITTVERLSPGTEVSASGIFSAVSDLSVLSETQGQVIRIYKKKGQAVKKGDLLAQVEKELIEAEFAAAESNYEKLLADQERFTKLAERDAVTQRQLEEVSIGLKSAEAQYRAATKRLDNTSIRATANGILHEDYIQEGSYVSPGLRLYDIVDVSKLKLNVSLTAEEVLKVNIGDHIEIGVRSYPDTEFSGEVMAVAAKADAALKYDVEILLVNNQEKPLKAGMYATAVFDFKNPDQKLYLNREALVGSIQNPEVYTISNGTSQLRKINIGEVRDDLVEVISGLDEGENVVLSGQINLQEGTKVNVIKQ